MFTTISIVILVIVQLINNYRINALRESEKKLKSSIQSVKDSFRSTTDRNIKVIEKYNKETRQVFSSYLGIKSIEMKNNESHLILEDDNGLMFMDLCKMNKQFTQLLKVGKTIPSGNERLSYNGTEYHYVPVKEVPCTDF